MTEDLNGQRRLRPLAMSAAVILGATTALACGDSSDKTSGESTAAATSPAASTSAAATTGTATVPPGQKEFVERRARQERRDRARVAQGTVQLTVMPIGTKGVLEVKPAGAVDTYHHWYKAGTKVTVRAKDTKVARFAEWGGACTGKARVCTVKVTEPDQRAVAGFLLDAKAAKGLSPDDPALKPALVDQGYRP